MLLYNLDLVQAGVKIHLEIYNKSHINLDKSPCLKKTTILQESNQLKYAHHNLNIFDNLQL